MPSTPPPPLNHLQNLHDVIDAGVAPLVDLFEVLVKEFLDLNGVLRLDLLPPDPGGQQRDPVQPGAAHVDHAVAGHGGRTSIVNVLRKKGKKVLEFF